MPQPFHELTVEQFADMLSVFPFTRKINAVHMHHTWRPNHSDFAAREPRLCIEGMWRFHTQTRGFSDIAQHITIDPRGKIWTGRNWNTAPASATGHNGNSTAGPFMFEMIGDFDKGRDPFDGPQRNAAIEVIAQVQKRFGLLAETLRFHNQMSTKTCPGSFFDYAKFLDEVRAAHERLAQSNRSRSLGTFGIEASEMRETTRKLIAMMDGVHLNGRGAAADDELDEEQMNARDAELSAGDADAAARFSTREARAALTPADKETLRCHTVNLRLGAFSEGGEFQTSQADVERIFGELLPVELAARKAQGKKLKLVFYAHGGLNAERPSLDNVLRRLAFWRNNGMYPIYFVWETGLKETLVDIVKGFVGGRREAGARFDISGFTDPLLEAASRQGGLLVWSQMKRSAELGVLQGGGSLFVAGKTAEIWSANHADMEIHAVGHSAGSIFHAHFLPCLTKQKTQSGAPPIHVESLHFLAPACTTDLFKTKLKDDVGKDKPIRSLVTYTMRREHELADTAGPYKKSLLYLVSRAFEPQQPAPILGLEESIRSDSRLLRFFGLAGHSGATGTLLFSPTVTDAGPREATQSLTHGDFDNDVPTMNSVGRRIMGAADDESIFSFIPEVTREVEAPEPFAMAAPLTAAAPTAPPPALTGGRRRALCIGINAYASPNQLNGCVNDAESWARLLTSMGFEASLLLDAQATRAGILEALKTLLSQSRAGDTVVFQFAGHGTQVNDLDGDEADGKDEALCPADLHTGALIIDDDLREVFAGIPDGVQLTCFTDCCHSGTITRLAHPTAGGAAPGKARFIPESPEINAAHTRFRAALGTRAVAPRDASRMREVLFSACLAQQVAYENNGSGDFTRHATAILAQGINMTNEQFEAKVRELFGPQPRQLPELDCAPAARALPLFGGLRAAAANGAANLAGAHFTGIEQRLASIEARLQRLGA